MNESPGDLPAPSPAEPAAGAQTPRAILASLFAGAPASPALALQQAAERARGLAYVVLPLGLQPATEARELASLHAAIALQSVRHGRPLAPTVLLSAGPVLRGGAPAGAADFALALALSLDENPLIHACACAAPHPGGALAGTGFWIGPDTVRRSLAAGHQPGASLVKGEAPVLLAAMGDAFEPACRAEGVLRAVLISVD